MFYEIVNNLCKERKTNITKMAQDIGLSNAAPSSWKKGAIPKATTLEKIAQYFDVSTDYLLGKTAEKKPADLSISRLKDTRYYELSPENQKLVDQMIEKLYKSQSID